MKLIVSHQWTVYKTYIEKCFDQNDNAWERICGKIIIKCKELLWKWLCKRKGYYWNDYACKRHFIKWLYIEKGCH